MTSIHSLLAALGLWLLAASSVHSEDEAGRPPLEVVATFSILGDLVQAVGGDRITLHVLVGPDSDGHLYQPTPADARLLRGADLVVSNGLGFEGWIDRFVHAAEFEGAALVASSGIEPLYIEVGERQEVDPHAWQSIANVRTYVDNISAALQQARPEHAEWFAVRAVAYQQELDLLAAEIHTALAQLPQSRRSIVTSHDAFGYFGREHQLRFLAPMGLSTDSEASARDLSALIRQIRAERIGAVFIENISDPRLMQRITAETGARMGGVLYSDALSAVDGPAATYINMLRHNLHTLMAALLPEPDMENPHD